MSFDPAGRRSAVGPEGNQTFRRLLLRLEADNISRLLRKEGRQGDFRRREKDASESANRAEEASVPPGQTPRGQPRFGPMFQSRRIVGHA